MKMGQYFILINLDKKECICSWNLSTGAKLWEWCANNICRLLPFLLRKSSENGGGDIRKDYKNAGRWAGNKIVLVGDYDDSKLYQKARDKFKDISKEVVEEFNDFIEIPEHKLSLASEKCGSCNKDILPSEGKYISKDGYIVTVCSKCWELTPKERQEK